jgi:hypothetical protein
LRSAGVEEARESSERRVRVGREAVWKRRARRGCGRDGPSHQGDGGNGAEGSGPNTGAGSGAGTDGARIQETKAEQAECPDARNRPNVRTLVRIKIGVSYRRLYIRLKFQLFHKILSNNVGIYDQTTNAIKKYF